jgi:hypothetical protein
MAFFFVKTASKVYVVTTAGVATELTLPTGVDVIAGQIMRGAVLDRAVIGVNGVTRPLWVDPDGATPVSRVMALPVPQTPCTLTVGAAGALIGTFNMRVSFLVKGVDGDVLAQSPFGPASNDVTVASQDIHVAGIPCSSHAAVNARRLARTTDGPGELYYEWLDVDDNTTTSIEDGLSDEALSTLPIDDELGMPPADLELIVEWKQRLWGKSHGQPDSLFYSGDSTFYAWSSENEIAIPPFGNDLTGINGFIRRRDELGVGRLDRWWKIIGDDPDNFARVVLIEGTGIEAPDSTVTIKDIGYWLAKDGVYRWGPDGVRCVSSDKVHAWFTTDDYFNRALFYKAIGWWDPRFDSYNLLLCAAGSTSLDRWVEFQIEKKRWFGPHKTDALTPTFAALLSDASVNHMPTICGSNGFLYKQNQATASDDATGIPLDMRLRHNCKTPDIDKVFLELSMLTRQESGGTLTITPALGGLNATSQTGISHGLTLERRRCRRISSKTQAQETGRILTLTFTNSEVAQPVHIYGYELPYHEAGRR